MTYRYYSTMRPVMIGGYPARDHVVEIHNFDDREFVDEIGRRAWGYIEYDQPLSKSDAKNYELVAGKLSWTVEVIRRGRATVKANTAEEAIEEAARMEVGDFYWDGVIDEFEIEAHEEEEE